MRFPEPKWPFRSSPTCPARAPGPGQSGEAIARFPGSRFQARADAAYKSGRAMTQPSAGPALAYPGHLLTLGQALVYRGAVIHFHFHDAAIGPLRVPVRHGRSRPARNRSQASQANTQVTH